MLQCGSDARAKLAGRGSLSYLHEIESADALEAVIPQAELFANELRMAKMITDVMSVDDVDLSQYRDTYIDRMRDLIQKKSAGAAKVAPMMRPDVLFNLTDVLQKSLAAVKKDKRRKAS